MSAYVDDAPPPPVGTRVLHHVHGPGTVVSDRVEFSQWLIEFDLPVVQDDRSITRAWCHPHSVQPADETVAP